MKEISTSKKIRAVRLFLSGLSYDEIARNVGIAKGSVVYIINDFRAGLLPIPPDMVEYVDELRQLSVDLRKHDTNIAQAKSYLKLESKLKEMGVGNEQAEQWLDICQDIASGTVSSRQFVDAALELARLSSEKGMGYGDLVADCTAKLRELAQIDTEIKRKKDELDTTKQEKERTTKELDSITAAMATAGEAFQKQKDQLKSELDEYIAQNKLSWNNVKLVESVVNSGLESGGLSKPEIEKAQELIIATGSLLKLIKKLESRRNQLQSEVDQRAKLKKSYSKSLDQLRDSKKALDRSIGEKRYKEIDLDVELTARRAELAKVAKEIANKDESLYIAHIVIDFLAAPDTITDYDLDRFVSIMIRLRQKQLGIEPRRVIDDSGHIICECQVPKFYSDFDAEKVDINHARELFALCLAPLVKDEFVSRRDYDRAQSKHEIAERLARVQGIAEERWHLEI